MILIDWLVDVAVEFHLGGSATALHVLISASHLLIDCVCVAGDATLALTAQIIGRFLSVENVEKRELQLLGVTCMWIASKMEEVSVPLVSDFAWITYDTYTTAEVRLERHGTTPGIDHTWYIHCCSWHVSQWYIHCWSCYHITVSIELTINRVRSCV